MSIEVKLNGYERYFKIVRDGNLIKIVKEHNRENPRLVNYKMSIKEENGKLVVKFDDLWIRETQDGIVVEDRWDKLGHIKGKIVEVGTTDNTHYIVIKP